MFRRLHYLKLVNLPCHCHFDSSSSAVKVLPTRSSEVRQFRRHLVKSKSLSDFDLERLLPHRLAVPSPASFFNDPTHLRVDLYVQEAEADSTLRQIYECDSMQQVFDIFTSLLETSSLNEKRSSQCLITLWDIQKFMFSLGHLFDPPMAGGFKPAPSSNYLNRDHYIETLRNHPVLQEIVSHVVHNCVQLDDEPLAASLLVVKRLGFPLRHQNCQKLIGELLQRKSRLVMPALSRFCVALRNEGLYGYYVQSELTPLFISHIEKMQSDEDVRSVSIALRSSFRILNFAILQKYREKLSEMLLDPSVTDSFQVVTLCKVIMLLYDCLLINEHKWSNAGNQKILSAPLLLRSYSKLLAPRVDQMTEMDVITMYKFILHQQEPVALVDAVSKRVLQLVEMSPNLDLVTCVNPKNLQQKLKLGSYINDFMENCTYFEKVSPIVLRILLKVNYDRDLYDKFWGKLSTVILERKLELETENKIIDDSEEAISVDSESESESDNFYSGRYKIISYAHEYLNFVHRTNRAYNYPKIEQIFKDEIISLLKDVGEYKVILNPSGYAKCIGFLVYLNYPNIQYRWNEDFMKNLRVTDLMSIQKGLDLRWRRNDSFEISKELNEQAERLLKIGDLHPFEYIGVAKISVEFQKNFESSPNFMECVRELMRVPWDDSRIPKELMVLVMRTSFCEPEMLERLSKFVMEFKDDLPVNCAEKFTMASYICAAEGLEGIPEAAKIIKRNCDRVTPLSLLQLMLCYCYHGCLDLELTNQVFDVDFLDAVDEQIKAFHGNSARPMKIRQTFMELNRAVCIDKPEANVPWFHQKFCQEVASVSSFRDSYLHREVEQVLSEILHSQTYVGKNVYSSYYYLMDFFVQFDKNGDPLKPLTTTKGDVTPHPDAVTKVAVLLQNPRDYTTHVRRLKGYHKLKTRHLEILGYRVIHIDPLVWNSMRMSERLAKNDYLQACIFNKS